MGIAKMNKNYKVDNDCENPKQPSINKTVGAETDKTVGTKLSIDGFLEIVGGFGRYQWLLEVFFILMHVTPISQNFIAYFIAIEPDWKCIDNSTICLLNGTFPSTDDYRCKIPRSEWQFTEPKSKTIVAEYDLYCSTSYLIYMVTSIFFIGSICGTFTTGWLADKYGRKSIMYPSFAILLTVALLSTAMPNIGLFLLCRFIAGLFSDSSINQMFTILTETVSTKHRPLAANILWLGWIGALCLLPLVAYLVSEWKKIVIILSAPFVITLFSYFFVTESARWYRSVQRYGDAKKVFRKIARFNKKTFDEDLEINEAKTPMKRTTYLDLFKTKKLAICSISLGFVWLVICMVYYGISLAADELGGSLYLNWVYISLVEIPSAIMAIFCSNRFGRKLTTITSMIVGGIFCIVVPFMPSSDGGNPTKVILGVLGKMFVTLSYDVIAVWSDELFSTDIRSKGLSFVYITAGVGSTSSPWITKALKVYSEYLPFAVMGVFAIIGGFVAILLPETRGQDTQDTMEEAKSSTTSTPRDSNASV